MKRIYLNEENLPPKLPVSFSTKINNNINLIKDYNQNNLDALSKWYDYIDNLKSYISHRKIAWDYVNRYAHFPNGAVHLVELGYDVYFIVKTNNTTQTNYVYVFKLNLKPKEFGLNIPPTLKENKIQNSYNTMKNKKVIRLTESDLHMLIEEAVNNTLNEMNLDRNYTDDEGNKISGKEALKTNRSQGLYPNDMAVINQMKHLYQVGWNFLKTITRLPQNRVYRDGKWRDEVVDATVNFVKTLETAIKHTDTTPNYWVANVKGYDPFKRPNNLSTVLPFDPLRP